MGQWNWLIILVSNWLFHIIFIDLNVWHLMMINAHAIKFMRMCFRFPFIWSLSWQLYICWCLIRCVWNSVSVSVSVYITSKSHMPVRSNAKTHIHAHHPKQLKKPIERILSIYRKYIKSIGFKYIPLFTKKKKYQNPLTVASEQTSHK